MSRHKLSSEARIVPALILIAMTAGSLMSATAAESPADSCIQCHRNPNFLVTNRKLYDYFQKWQESVHKEEGLSCADCHGGNPKAAEKEIAHGAHLSQAETGSTVNFQNIPNTCGDCHPDIYEGFRKSKHFEHVLAQGKEVQGPTCVTCHGSINAAVVHVNTVEQTCTACHNAETKNHPEVARKASDLLYRFLSIQRFYRYVTVRGNPAETAKFLKQADAKLHDLSKTWHTFDLPKIEADTQALLTLLKEKRQEVGREKKKKQNNL